MSGPGEAASGVAQWDRVALTGLRFGSLTPEYGRFFRGANRAVLPEPTGEANRGNLGHLTPKTLQKALYVGSSQIGRPPQVVCFGWSLFPVPEACLPHRSSNPTALSLKSGPTWTAQRTVSPSQRKSGCNLSKPDGKYRASHPARNDTGPISKADLAVGQMRNHL